MANRSWIRRLFGLNRPSRRARRDRNGTVNRPRLLLEELETRTLLSPVVSVLPIQPQEGIAFNGPIATFVDSGRSDPASDYQVQVNWGDGSTDSVTPSLVNGQWTITDSHTYTAAATRTLQVKVSNTITSLSGTGNTPIEVVQQAPVVQVNVIAPLEGKQFSGAVATFTDPAGAEPLADYAATIAWGDGTTSAGTISVSNGVFTVSGSHTYAEEGGDTLRVTVTDDAGLAGANTWTTEKSMPTARDDVAAVLGANGLIYVVGGADANANPLATLAAYNRAANTWATEASMSTARDAPAAALGPNGLIYVFGGANVSGNTLASVEAYNPATNAWTAEASMPTATATAAAVLGPDGLIYVIGGADTNGDPLGTVQVYNPASNTWATKSSMPTPRDNITAALGADGQLYVFGGDNGTGGPLATVEAYNPATDTWTTKASMPIARDSAAAASAIDGQIYVFGGGNSLTTVQAYDPASNTWTTEASMLTGSDALAAAPGPDGRLYVFGGANAANAPLSTVAAYQPAGATGTSGVLIDVVDQAPVVQMLSISASTGEPFSGAVATFTDPAGAEPAGNYAATIDWGDGTTSTGTITVSNGVFTVSGSHTYTASGSVTLSVTVTDDGGEAGADVSERGSQQADRDLCGGRSGRRRRPDLRGRRGRPQQH